MSAAKVNKYINEWKAAHKALPFTATGLFNQTSLGRTTLLNEQVAINRIETVLQHMSARGELFAERFGRSTSYLANPLH